MTIKIYNFRNFNLGDFLNVFPVISGLSKSFNDTVKLVLPDNFRSFSGVREFFEYQSCIESVYFKSEVFNMDSDYLLISYCDNEMKDCPARPLRPIETTRHEVFIRDNYPNIGEWSVDDDFCFLVNNQSSSIDPDLYVVGDRWSKVTDTRRDWNILKKSGLFENPFKFYFLDYEKYDMMTNACIIKESKKPFIGTFTGSGMLSDLLNKETICFWDDSMKNWNSADITYSFWKHFYGNRNNKLLHISDPELQTILT